MGHGSNVLKRSTVMTHPQPLVLTHSEVAKPLYLIEGRLQRQKHLLAWFDPFRGLCWMATRDFQKAFGPFLSSAEAIERHLLFDSGRFSTVSGRLGETWRNTRQGFEHWSILSMFHQFQMGFHHRLLTLYSRVVR